MFKRLALFVIIASLICTLGGTVTFANKTFNPDEKADPAKIPSELPPKEEIKSNEQLKRNMLKLVADAKAGKIAVVKSQTQPAKRNNLSTKTKIAIGVGIAVVVLVVVVIHAKNHLFDDFHPFRQGGN
jgi:hypothetical protein